MAFITEMGKKYRPNKGTPGRQGPTVSMEGSQNAVKIQSPFSSDLLSPCYKPGTGLGTGDTTAAKKTSTFPAHREFPFTYHTKGLALNNSDTNFRKLRSEQTVQHLHMDALQSCLPSSSFEIHQEHMLLRGAGAAQGGSRGTRTYPPPPPIPSSLALWLICLRCGLGPEASTLCPFLH